MRLVLTGVEEKLNLWPHEMFPLVEHGMTGASGSHGNGSMATQNVEMGRQNKTGYQNL